MATLKNIFNPSELKGWEPRQSSFTTLQGRVRISIFLSTVQYMYHITPHGHRERNRFRDLNLKTNLIHTIFMRSDFMLGRSVCTIDDNIAVIQPWVVCMFQYIRYKGSIKCAIDLSFMLLSWANC